MKKIVFVFLTALAAGVVFAVDPAEGFWISLNEKTGEIEAGWEIYQEKGKLYGKVVSSAIPPKPNGCRRSYRDFPLEGPVNEIPMIGTPWIFGLRPGKEAGQWKNGHVIDPTLGFMYDCRITFHPADSNRYPVDTLEMRGSLLGIGRSLYFRKSTREIVLALTPP